MNLILPADLELLNQFRPLVKQLGGVKAIFLVHGLWRELAFQCRVHGKPGLFRHREREYFEWTIRESAIDDPVALLLQSGLLEPLGDDWVCPLFESLHRDLDPARLKPSVAADRAFVREIQMHASAADALISGLPTECWRAPDGTTAPRDVLKRALTLVRFLDGQCGSPTRKPCDFTPGVLQAAIGVCMRYDDAKLTLIERRINAYQNQHGIEAYREAEHVLASFDALVLAIYPNEGFLPAQPGDI